MPKTFYDAEGNILGTFYTAEETQPTLVSGTNIKTINNESLLGSGNITISGGGSTLYLHKVSLYMSGNNSELYPIIFVINSSNTQFSSYNDIYSNRNKIISYMNNSDSSCSIDGNSECVLTWLKFDTSEVEIYGIYGNSFNGDVIQSSDVSIQSDSVTQL